MANKAEHQAAWRARRQQRIAELEARGAELEAENERLRKALPEPEVPPADDTQRAELVEIGQVTKQILMEALSAARPDTKRRAALAEMARKDLPDFELGCAVMYKLRTRPGLPISGWCTIGGYELTDEEIRNYIDSGDAGRIRRLCELAESEWTD